MELRSTIISAIVEIRINKQYTRVDNGSKGPVGGAECRALPRVDLGAIDSPLGRLETRIELLYSDVSALGADPGGLRKK